MAPCTPLLLLLPATCGPRAPQLACLCTIKSTGKIKLGECTGPAINTPAGCLFRAMSSMVLITASAFPRWACADTSQL